MACARAFNEAGPVLATARNCGPCAIHIQHREGAPGLVAQVRTQLSAHTCRMLRTAASLVADSSTRRFW